MRKITVEVTAIIIVGIIVGLFHGIIGWVIAGIDRLNLTIPTYFDSISFFAVNFIISNVFALVALLGIKSDKFFMVRCLVVYVSSVFITDSIFSTVDSNWIVSVLYGLLMGVYACKGWSKKYLKYRSGMSEQMIRIMEQIR